MNIFTKNKLVHKIIIALILVMMLSSIFIKPVQAINLEKLGGKLLNPVMSLFVVIGDGVMGLIQENILGMNEPLIHIDTTNDFWAILINALIVAVVTVALIAGVILTAGTGLTVLAMVGVGLKCVGIFVVCGTATAITFPITSTILDDALSDNVYLPIYNVSPYEIFSNELPILDVNFFSPMKVTGEDGEKEEKKYANVKKVEIFPSENNRYELSDGRVFDSDSIIGNIGNVLYPGIENYYVLDKIKDAYNGKIEKSYDIVDNKKTEEISFTDGKGTKYYIVKGYEIDVNVATPGITNGIKGYYGTLYVLEEDDLYKESIAEQLRGIISGWYVNLRNFAVVISMVVLLYIGIKIITSTIASDKAKYKQMLVDWLVSICLIFAMQYIMTFSNTFVGYLTNAINSIQYFNNPDIQEYPEKMQGVNYYQIADEEIVEEAYEKLVEDRKDKEYNYKNYFFTNRIENGGTIATSKSNAKILGWPASNFMEQARIELQLLNRK